MDSGPGLYIHVPFCERKCVYCDFYSVERRDATEEFLGALVREIDTVAGDPSTQAEFATLFFGGGTPSLLAPRDLGRILDAVRRRFSLRDDVEITVECNPGTIDAAKLAAYRALGVNRLSIGVQSFHDDELAFLGRIHDADVARRAVRDARRAGFDNLSIDLIYALPGQTMARWEETLAEAVALAPEHVSAYSLIFEEGTPLYAQRQRGHVHPIDEETDAALFLRTVEFLGAHGYVQYEVSNFARPIPDVPIAGDALHDLRCSRHNLNYWRRGAYLGFGPSAHSFWRGERRWNASNLGVYLAAMREGASPVTGRERPDVSEAITESVALGLRSDGIRLRAFRDFFNLDFFARFGARCAPLVAAGLLAADADRVRCTTRGYLLCDALTLELLQA